MARPLPGREGRSMSLREALAGGGGLLLLLLTLVEIAPIKVNP